MTAADADPWSHPGVMCARPGCRHPVDEHTRWGCGVTDPTAWPAQCSCPRGMSDALEDTDPARSFRKDHQAEVTLWDLGPDKRRKK